MEARYLDQIYAWTFVIRKLKIFSEPNEFMIGASAVPSSKKYSHFWKSPFNRAILVFGVFLSAILVIVFGQVLLHNYSIACRFKLEDYGFENINKKINKIYSAYPMDSLNEKNILGEI
jgi:hypothetical protein